MHVVATGRNLALIDLESGVGVRDRQLGQPKARKEITRRGCGLLRHGGEGRQERERSRHNEG